eukprot:scaffold56867_cov33-Prasinocladus_malaysianus.AAC.2
MNTVCRRLSHKVSPVVATFASAMKKTSPKKKSLALLCLALVLGGTFAAVQDSCDKCDAVLQSVYNTASGSSTYYSLLEHETALCNFDSSYTYDKYVSSSISGSSSNAGVDALIESVPIGFSGGTVSESQFSSAKTKIVQLKSQLCTNGAMKAVTDVSEAFLSQVVDGTVVKAWETCIQTCKVEENGITAALTYSNDQRSATITIQFVKDKESDSATIYAVSEIGMIECQCFGLNWSDCKQPVDLEQGLSYHVQCSRPDVGFGYEVAAFPPASATVMTSAGSTLQLSLPEEVPPSTKSSLETMMSSLSEELSSLQFNVQELFSSLRDQQEDLKKLEQAASTTQASLQDSINAISKRLSDPKDGNCVMIESPPQGWNGCPSGKFIHSLHVHYGNLGPPEMWKWYCCDPYF